MHILMEQKSSTLVKLTSLKEQKGVKFKINNQAIEITKKKYIYIYI